MQYIHLKQTKIEKTIDTTTNTFVFWIVYGLFWGFFWFVFGSFFGSFFAYISYQGQKVKFRLKTLAFLTQLNPHHFFSRYNTEGFINSGFQTRAENDAKHPEFA